MTILSLHDRHTDGWHNSTIRPPTGRPVEQEFVRPRWPYDMRPSARAEKYIRDAGPYAKTEVFLFWMFARKTVQL